MRRFDGRCQTEREQSIGASQMGSGGRESARPELGSLEVASLLDAAHLPAAAGEPKKYHQAIPFGYSDATSSVSGSI
jgi:hypothetical protein